MKKSIDWLPWVVSSACFAGSLAAPSFAKAIWGAGLVALLPCLVIELRKPVNYQFLEFDSVGFRFSPTSRCVDEVKWEEVTDVYYLRQFNPFANQIDTEWEFHRAASRPVVVLVEWPQKKPFARAVVANIPAVSSELVGQAVRYRVEGRWSCLP